MGNDFFKQPRAEDAKYDKQMIIYLRANKTMEDVHESIEYLRQYYQTTQLYKLSEFKEVFESFFDQYTETVFKLLENNKDPAGEVDVYETIALMCILNGDDFERRLDYIFRLFDFNYSDTLEINEFILTISTAMKSLCKVVCIKPPLPKELEYFAKNFFNKADTDNDDNVNKQEFVNFCDKNWDLQDWFLKYADLNTVGNTDRRCKEKLDQYMKIFPGKTDIEKKNQEDYVKQEADEQIIEQLITQQCPQIKPETKELLMAMLKQTSQYLNPQLTEGCINYAAYSQVFKAWAAFDACDINEDNIIDSNEMEFLLYALEGDKPDKFRIKREIQTMDTDNSGNINRKEWIEFLCIDPTNSGKMVFREGLRSLFNKYDTNNSGELDENEIRALLKEHLQQFKSRWETQQIQEIMQQNFQSMQQEIINLTINQLIRELRVPTGDVLVVQWTQFKRFMEKQMQEQQKLKEFLDEYSK